VKLGSFFKFLFFPPTRAAFREYFRRWVPVLKNLISSDVYTMASAISTCAVISFFPFVILLISMVHAVESPLNVKEGTDWITNLMAVYLPYLSGGHGDPANIAKDIAIHGSARIHIISVLILIVSAMGVFIPIEVTLNRIWGSKQNLSFVKNQAVSFGVVLISSTLSIVAFLSGGFVLWLLRNTIERLEFMSLARVLERISVNLVGFLLSMALFFVIFYMLPNIRMKFDTLIRASIFTGVVWELGRYAYLWSLKKLDLVEIYGSYFTSAVVLILWSYVSAMIMILGAELAHRELLSLNLFQPAIREWRSLQAESSRPL